MEGETGNEVATATVVNPGTGDVFTLGHTDESIGSEVGHPPAACHSVLTARPINAVLFRVAVSSRTRVGATSFCSNTR